MNTNAKWIKAPVELGELCPEFRKSFSADKKISRAVACVSALGMYNLYINGKKVENYLFAPGYTSYAKRVQFQRYDITEYLFDKNDISILCAKGWCHGALGTPPRPSVTCSEICVIASFEITYEDGEKETISTDESWMTKGSFIRYSDFYQGEVIDARFSDKKGVSAKILKWSKSILIPQEGEKIIEHERLKPVLIKTPNGEKILDFGQNMTGYVEFSVMAKEGEKLIFDCGEILDKDGNFYRDNYRAAKTLTDYTCKEGLNTYKPKFSFQALSMVCRSIAFWKLFTISLQPLSCALSMLTGMLYSLRPSVMGTVTMPSAPSVFSTMY